MKLEYYIIGGMLFLMLGTLALIAVSPSDVPLPKQVSGAITISTEPEKSQGEAEPVVESEDKVFLSETPVEEPVVVEETEVAMAPIVSIPEGSGVPGCEVTNKCFIPYELKVAVGTEVTWNNEDAAAHTVTSGTVDGGPDGTFDSSIFMAGTSFSHKFDAAGEYNYFCMVHPWMKGVVIVE